MKLNYYSVHHGWNIRVLSKNDIDRPSTILSNLNISSNFCITDTCDNHDCAQTCSVTEGGVRECSCGDGYELGADNKSCDGKVL